MLTTWQATIGFRKHCPLKTQTDKSHTFYYIVLYTYYQLICWTNSDLDPKKKTVSKVNPNMVILKVEIRN